ALRPARAWALRYPLRRACAFARLAPAEQSAILREHAVIGRAYGDADLAHDIRLACHGLDTHDNDFVIGLCGRALHPLSHLVQTMRRTAQTSEYIPTLGPFFVGHVLWQSKTRWRDRGAFPARRRRSWRSRSPFTGDARRSLRRRRCRTSPRSSAPGPARSTSAAGSSCST